MATTLTLRPPENFNLAIFGQIRQIAYTHTHTHTRTHPTHTHAPTHTQLRDISMTQDMDPGRLNIITYDMVTGTKFILRAPKTSVRDRWLSRANELIRLAKQNNTGFMRGRSASEPGESLARTPTFMRRSVFKRESTKRKSRPPSSSGRRSVTPEQQVRNLSCELYNLYKVLRYALE